MLYNQIETRRFEAWNGAQDDGQDNG